VNTIGFDVESVGGTRRISTLDFIKFLKDDVGVMPADIKSIQRHPIAPYCFLGLHDEETMNGIWTNISSGVQWTNKGEVYPFLCTESYTEVKVKGMIPGTDPLVVSALLYEFGEVLTCKEFKTKIEGAGRSALCDTGDFLLRMRLDEPIPRLLPSGSDGDVWVVYYEGQEDACWKCMKPGHMTRECRSQGTNDFTKEQRAGKLAYRAMNEAMEDDREAGESEMEDAVSQPAESGLRSLHLQFTSTPINDDGGVAALQADSNASVKPAAPVVPTIQLNSQVVEDISQDLFASSHDTGVAKEKTALFTPGNTQDLLEAVNDIEDRDDSEVFMSSQPEQSMSKKQLKKLKQQEKKREGSQSNTSSSSPKRSKATGSLSSAPLGDRSDMSRATSPGSLDPVRIPPKMMTPAERVKKAAEQNPANYNKNKQARI
jgi:hypothetical protein